MSVKWPENQIEDGRIKEWPMTDIDSLGQEIYRLQNENERLRAENESLKALVAEKQKRIEEQYEIYNERIRLLKRQPND